MMIFPVEAISVPGAVVNNFSIELPRTTKEKMTDVHRRDITVSSVAIELSNRKRNQHAVRDPDIDFLVQPAQRIRAGCG